jgi:beta-N-acetylhexosaminidase
MEHFPSLAGRTLMVGLPGPRLDDATEKRLAAIGPGGVILFARNLETPDQTGRLLEAVRRTLGYPLLAALDQEGGRVSRLRPWIGETPPAAALARAGADAASRFGRSTGRALRALGFNLDFAPVVDLCSADAANGIGNRSFGVDAERVTALAGAFLDGLQAEGVAGCLKHFPGLGSTSVDSHEALPVAERPAQELRAQDLVPFACLASRAACVMISHGSYPSLDPGSSSPATLSAAIVERLLREELHFEGLVVSDDLEMGAVATFDDDGAAAVGAMRAGCDLLPYCASLDRAERARAALLREAAADPRFATRLAEAAATVSTATARWPAAADPSGWDAARGELARFATRA